MVRPTWHSRQIPVAWWCKSIRRSGFRGGTEQGTSRLCGCGEAPRVLPQFPSCLGGVRPDCTRRCRLWRFAKCDEVEHSLPRLSLSPLLGHDSSNTPTRTDHGSLRYAKKEGCSSRKGLASDMAFLPSLRVAADVKASGPGSLTSGEAAIEKGIITRLESCRDRDLTRRSDMSNTGSVVRA